MSLRSHFSQTCISLRILWTHITLEDYRLLVRNIKQDVSPGDMLLVQYKRALFPKSGYEAIESEYSQSAFPKQYLILSDGVFFIQA
jgi:hypothetical protein